MSAVANTRPRLLVFGINYEPEPTGTALNTTWQTRSIPKFGWDVDVVTGIPHYPAWRPATPPPDVKDGPVRVQRRWHYVPNRQSASRRGLYELTWVVSALPAIVRQRRYAGVVGIVPSLGGAALAAAASTRFRAPYALVFQDIIGRAAAMSGIAGAKSVAGPVERLEVGLARRASGVAIVAEGFESYFRDAGIDPSRIHRIRNPARLDPPLEERAAVRQRLGWENDEFVVLHSGSMGFKQGLENLIEAAAMTRADENIRFVLQGDGNQRANLEALVRRRQLGNVQFLPIASEAEFPGILAAADALLLNQRAAVLNMSLPAKLAIYFAAGVPVIAAVHDGDETARDIRRSGAGMIVPPEAPARLLEAARALRADPDGSASLGAAGRAYATTHLSEDAVLRSFERFLRASFGEAPPSQRSGEEG